MIKIVLADDHHVVRQGLHALLMAEPDLIIVGEAADGIETLELVQQLQPDVLVLDLIMPELGGIEVARRVTGQFQNVSVIILSMYSNMAYVVEAIRNGAGGYVLKKSTADDLVDAVRAVAAGRRYLSPFLSEKELESYLQKTPSLSQNLYELLTPRQREVLYLVATGLTSAQIAHRLSISPRTIEMHRARLMQKLNLHSQAELIHYALKHGLIPPEDNLAP